MNIATLLNTKHGEGADLHGADLSGANLRGANLHGAVLPTGETWEKYLAEVVLALCAVGNAPLHTIAEAWTFHTWQNCPMAIAFDVHTIEEVPALYRQRVEQFIQLFDARLVPCPVS